ncbi:hypothetical protein LCD52_20150 [Rossellomorea vietnamensis]|uniref:hypothetical protein n=1 Tax=Rossellomorea vietnamensis TaxID=218284 RepID=UPI001CCFD3AC|nr:hypothetical protein [Rossellomorea vietnamensis]MCA0151053.1 hypothetical protein [Rossellomorea vietnamensis]
MKIISIVLGVILLVAKLANLHTIIASAKWYSFEHNKNVSTETKTITYRDMFERLYQQRKVAAELEDTIVYSRIGDEVRKGADEASDYEILLAHNEQITSLKVKLPITTLTDGDKNLEFISGHGEVLEICEDSHWEDFNGSLQELMKKAQ